MQHPPSATLKILQGANLFASLPNETIAALGDIAMVQTRTAKHVLFLEGDPAPGVYVVSQGRVKISRISPNGREQIMTIVTPGHHFNIVPVFDGGPCPANAEIMMESELLLLPTIALRALVTQHPTLALLLLKECSSHMRSLVNLVDDLALRTVQGRLAKLLVHAATNEHKTPLTQAEVASQLGTVREMVGRTLRTFEMMGLIKLERGAIQVINQKGLMAQADDN